MKALFDIDGPVLRFVTKLAYSVWLNILWFICCLPVFTAGASTTALFYVSLKIVKDEEGHLTRSFFHSFKENFGQSTIIWLILLAVGILLGVDGYVFYHMRYDSALWALGAAVFIIMLAAYAIILMYIFPFLARFDNTVRAMFKNALMIGMRFLLCTALMAFIYFIMAVVVVRIFTPAIIFGEGLCALLCSYLLSNILILCEGKTEESQEEGNGVSEASESGDRKWSVKDVHGIAKVSYIWEYYKLPIAVTCILLYIAGYMICRNVTHKDTVLYTALVNVSAGDSFTEELSTNFLDYLGADAKKEQVLIYDGLYLAGEESNVDQGYIYASNTKIIGSIAGELLDVVLMDQTAFDIMSENGYLCNIEELLIREAPDLYEELQSGLTTNTAVIEDNAVDISLDSSIACTAETDEYPMAVDISSSDLVLKEEFNGTLYLGIITNAPHVDTAIACLRYLTASLP